MFNSAESSLLKRPRVVRVAAQLRHEQGPRFDDGADRIAVVAHYSNEPRVSRSTRELLGQLSSSGYTCALVSAADCPQPLQFGGPAPVAVYRRPNIGYDFGSWSAFMHAFPRMRGAGRVLLANDSLVGPFESLEPMLQDFDTCGTDIWGVTGSTQDAPHLQSYMLGFSDGVLDGDVLRRFWDGVRVQPTKRKLVVAYELGLSRLAHRRGLSTSAHFPWRTATSRGQNPTSQGWRRLILCGFPFVKRELVLHAPPEVPDASDIPRVVRDRWGQDVYEWV